MKFGINDLLYEISDALDSVEHELLGRTTYHSKRVAFLCLKVGESFGLSEDAISTLCGCAILHDNALTEYILSERNSHKDSQWTSNMRSHCVIGQANAEFFPFVQTIKDVILYHHENADGSGLFGKREKEIPLAAAIIKATDDIDVRFSLGNSGEDGLRAACSHIENQKGRLYDSEVAEALLKVLNSIGTEALQSETLLPMLKKSIPEVRRDCTNDEIRQIAQIIARITDYKSTFTCSHSIGIAQKSLLLVEHYGYDEDFCTKVYLAAALHDIGKLHIKTEILEKPGPLTPPEYAEIQKHIVFTYEILSRIEGFETICRWASSHHEKLDGTGYPFGKKADEMDFVSRMLCCVDIYQAVSEERPYHNSNSHDKTLAIMNKMVANGFIDAEITNTISTLFANLNS